MNNNLKICLIIYITMNIEKSIVSNLEGDLDFGEPGLNALYKNLDKETKLKISDYSKDSKISFLLRKLSNPELKELWDSLSEKTKRDFESFGFLDRFAFLKTLKKSDSERSKEKKESTSSEIARLHKGDDSEAIRYRKALQRWDEEDRKKIKDGTYLGDPNTWQPRVKSKYVLPLTPQEEINIKKFSSHSPEGLPIQLEEVKKFSSHSPEGLPIPLEEVKKFSSHSPEGLPIPLEEVNLEVLEDLEIEEPKE